MILYVSATGTGTNTLESASGADLRNIGTTDSSSCNSVALGSLAYCGYMLSLLARLGGVANQ